MNTTSKKKISRIFSLSRKEKLSLESDLIHFAFIKHIQNHMGDMRKNELAKKVGVSASFVSQLFTGDKILNIPLLVKFQRALNFKFHIDSSSNDHIKQCDNIFPGLAKNNIGQRLKVNPDYQDFHTQDFEEQKIAING